MKREVRRRCGFGCVICGSPIVQYDHIREFSKVRAHEASNLVALCPAHHDDKTHGRLPIEVLRAANADPFNRKHGQTTPYLLHYGAAPIEVQFGSIVFRTSSTAHCVPLLVDGTEVVSWRFEDGVYLLTARWFDSDGHLVLEIVDNELVVNIGLWDVEFVANRLIIRSAAGVIRLEVVFNPPRRIIFQRGSFTLGKHDVAIDGPYLRLGTSAIRGGTVDAEYGLAVGANPDRRNVAIQVPNE